MLESGDGCDKWMGGGVASGCPGAITPPSALASSGRRDVRSKSVIHRVVSWGTVNRGNNRRGVALPP